MQIVILWIRLLWRAVVLLALCRSLWINSLENLRQCRQSLHLVDWMIKGAVLLMVTLLALALDLWIHFTQRMLGVRPWTSSVMSQTVERFLLW